jgi:transposase
VPGAKVADVARRHGVTRWQVYDWRRKLAAGKLAVPASAMSALAFAALVVEPPSSEAEAAPPKPAGRIELVVDGVTLRVGADVDEGRLAWVIRAVRAASR